MVVTAKADDAEMQNRIALHRVERGAGWTVIEEPRNLVGAIERLARPERIVVVDCLTLWLSNLSFDQENISMETARLAVGAKSVAGPIIFVTNELGLGLVPETRIGREFRDAQGRLNQAMAQACDRVIFVAAGLPLNLKPSLTKI